MGNSTRSLHTCVSECESVHRVEDVERDIHCKDGKQRTISGLRVPQSVTENISVTYDESLVPRGSPIESAIHIFSEGSGTIGQSFEGRMYLENGSQLHRKFVFDRIIPKITIQDTDTTIRTFWVSVNEDALPVSYDTEELQIKGMGRRVITNEDMLVNHRLGLAIGKVSYMDPTSGGEGLTEKFPVFDLETGKHILNFPVESIQFFEVPDETIASLLEEHGYSASLVSGLI